MGGVASDRSSSTSIGSSGGGGGGGGGGGHTDLLSEMQAKLRKRQQKVENTGQQGQVGRLKRKNCSN